MNRTEVIDAYFAFCKKVNRKPEEVILSAGAALVMFEERDSTNDLDIDISADDYVAYTAHAPGSVRRSSLGEYCDYDELVSLHPFPEGTGVSQHATPKGLVYTYSWMALVEQKIRLVEMPDRNPLKIPKDLEELDSMVLGLAFAGGDAGVKELIERAGRAKANWPL